MAGRKQHFIPQLLLRGFPARKTKKGKTQVWLYQRGKDPTCPATDNVFAQRDFYGSSPSGLDAAITENEQHLKTVVAEMRKNSRKGTRLIGRNSAIADLLFMIGIRSRWIRTVFERFGTATIEVFAKQAGDRPALIDLLKRQIAADPEFLRNAFRKERKAQLRRPLTLSEWNQVVCIADHLSANTEQFEDLFDPTPVQGLLQHLAGQMPSLAASGHNKGLSQSFDVTEYRRYLRRFSWSVVVDDNALYVLGDCGPLYADSGGSILGPMGIPNRLEIQSVLLPISESQLIVGRLESTEVGFGADEVNCAMSAWSMHGFVASRRSDYLLGLQENIGLKIDAYLESVTAEAVLP